MPKVTAYTDRKGKLHKTPKDAALSDLTAVFGQGETSSMAAGIANAILTNRASIEAIWAELDEETTPAHPLAESPRS